MLEHSVVPICHTKRLKRCHSQCIGNSTKWVSSEVDISDLPQEIVLSELQFLSSLVPLEMKCKLDAIEYVKYTSIIQLLLWFKTHI
jgi:hypothetical protein